MSFLDSCTNVFHSLSTMMTPLLLQIYSSQLCLNYFHFCELFRPLPCAFIKCMNVETLFFLHYCFILLGETLTTRRSTPTPPCTGTTVLSAHCASPQKVGAFQYMFYHFFLYLFQWGFFISLKLFEDLRQATGVFVLFPKNHFVLQWPSSLFLLWEIVCFVFSGTNLLSGGMESVLVQWRYNQESQRDFLPRLGAAITHIAVSPDGALFCTSHSDNSKEL